MQQKSITKNYIYNTIYQILSIIIPIITTPYISRVLGVTNIGINSYTLSIVTYFIVFANLGVSSYGTREIAMKRDSKSEYSKAFFELNIIKLITGLISITAYIIFILISNQYHIIYLILALNLISNIFDISWLYQGLEQYKFISVRNIIIKLIFTLSIFIFVNNVNDLNLYILLNSLSLILGTIILWIKVPKIIDKKYCKNLSIKKHLKNTLIYFLPQVATTIYTIVDKTMIGIITNSPDENGYYDQAYKIISLSLTLITSLNTVMSPRMSYLYKNNKKDEIKNRLTKSIKFVFLIGLPIVFGIIGITDDFVGWFFGNGYEKLNIILPIFSPIILIIGISNCLGSQVLTPFGKRLQSAKVLWIGAVINVILNSILISKFGSIGAVISSIAAESIITILYIWLAKKYLEGIKVLKNIFRYFICSIIMYLGIMFISIYLDTSIISTIVEISLGIIIYFILLIILKDDVIIEYLIKIKKKLGV